MDRPTLLGLAATLNVATAALERACQREAANHVNAAVCAIHHGAGWTAADLDCMAEAQAWVVRRLTAPLATMRQSDQV